MIDSSNVYQLKFVSGNDEVGLPLNYVSICGNTCMTNERRKSSCQNRDEYSVWNSHCQTKLLYSMDQSRLNSHMPIDE